MTGRLDTARIHSFQASHKVGNRPLRVDRIDNETTGLARDYLADLVTPHDDLPGAIISWLENSSDVMATVTFDETGMRLSDINGQRHFPAPADVPRIILPVAAIYAQGPQSLFGLSLGAEGYLYSVDVSTGRWRVVTSLDGYDAAALYYDEQERVIITTGAFSRPGEIRFFGLDGGRKEIFLPIHAFPGLTDLFDFGNEFGPPLVPRAYDGGWLLLEARIPGGAAEPDSSQYRVYAVHTDTKEVRLLAYRAP